MTKILLVNNSMRSVRASEEISKFVETVAAETDNVDLTVADLRELNMPFINSPVSPADPSFEITEESVKQWQKLVQTADAVVMLTPEYNDGMSSAHKNAIDWLYSEWKDKPIVAIGYSWSGAASALKHLNDVMHKVGAKILTDDAARLYFTKTIDLNGTVIDADTAQAEVKAALEAVRDAAS